MRLALLGSGPEAAVAAESLLAAGHVITHAGPPASLASGPLAGLMRGAGARPVDDHRAAVAAGAQEILLVSYGRLVEAEALARARFLNIHYALLPRFRGYHGLVWSLVNGDAEIGWTLHQVDEGIDSGPVFHQARLPIGPDDDVNRALAGLGDLLRAELGAAVARIESGQVPVPQDDARATYGSRRTPEDGRIDWHRPADHVANLVRALRPPALPGAFFEWRGERIVVLRATRLPNPPFAGPVGRVLALRGGSAWVMCGDRMLQLDEVARDGAPLPAASLFRTVGARLDERGAPA